MLCYYSNKKAGEKMKREEFLKKAIKKCGYNLKDFADKIDMPYTTLLSIVNKSVGGAALDNIIKICNGLNISIETLNPNIEHIDNNDIPKRYNELNPLGKQKADEYIDVLSENKKYTENQKSIDEDIIEELKQDVEKNTINTK